MADPFEPTPLPVLLLQHPLRLLLHTSYTLLSSLRSTPKPSDPPLRIVCISDTHTNIPAQLPAGDILIHAGDLTNAGSVSEIQAQVDWLARQPFQEIVVISGNHDTYLDPRTRPSLCEERASSVEWGRVRYLQHRRLSLTLDLGQRFTATAEPEVTERSRLLGGSSAAKQRKIVLYGAPQIPACGPMSVHAFQYERGKDAWSETVPEDTDILITHTPPKFHRDLPLPTGMGCEFLLKEVERVKPRLHVFGHVHWGAGKEMVWWDGCHEAYVKGMASTSTWFFARLCSPTVWMNIVRVCYRGLRMLIWDKVWGGQGPYTLMVNAAQMHGNTGKLGNPVQVVDI